MLLSLHLLIIWVLTGALIRSAKLFPPKQLAFVFLCANFLNTNLYYLIGETFKVFKLPEDALRYVSFALLQSFIIPAIIAIAVSACFHFQFSRAKPPILIISIGLLLCLEVMSVLIKIVVYDDYRILVALMGYRLFLLFVSFIALWWFRRMCEQS